MEWLGYAVIAVLMLAGFGLLFLVIRTQRRWLRVLLGLFSTWYLASCAALSLFGSMEQETTFHPLGIALAVIYALAALAALVLVFIPTQSAHQ